MTPFSTHRHPAESQAGPLTHPWRICVSSGRQGTAGPGPPDSPIRPSRSPTGPRAGGTTAKAHSPRAAAGGPSTHSGPASSPVWGGITAAAWGSTAVHPASGLPWTRIANPSVGQGNNSATQDALAIRVLRPAGTSGPAFLSHPFRSVRDSDLPLDCLREPPLGDPSLSRRPPAPSPPNK